MGHKVSKILLLPLLASSFLWTNCKSRNDAASVKLNTGTQDIEGTNFPGVYGLQIGNPKDSIQGNGEAFPMCTATAISKTVVITAAHCVDPKRPGAVYWLVDYNLKPVRSASGEIIMGSAMTSPYANSGDEPGQGFAFDIAVIQFQNAKFVDTYAFSNEQLKKGDPVELVGYGYDEKNGNVWRQFGINKINDIVNSKSIDPMNEPVHEFYRSMIWIRSDMSKNTPSKIVNTGTLPGDSGGPLLKDKKIIGILYGGAYWADKQPDKDQYSDSVYLNIQHKINLKFLKDVKSENFWDIPAIPTNEWSPY